jgi:Flp pilus assembly protein TadG
MLRYIPRARRSRRTGAAVVELAVLLPFLMYLCVIATDWARLYYYTVTVESCARNGALYASDQVTQKQSPYSSVQQAALAEAPMLDPTTATVTSTPTTDSTGAPAVIVTVSVPFNTFANFPGVPSSQTLTRSVQMQIAPVTTK